MARMMSGQREFFVLAVFPVVVLAVLLLARGVILGFVILGGLLLARVRIASGRVLRPRHRGVGGVLFIPGLSRDLARIVH